jgi:hypothetical protein
MTDYNALLYCPVLSMSLPSPGYPYSGRELVRSALVLKAHSGRTDCKQDTTKTNVLFITASSK